MAGKLTVYVEYCPFITFWRFEMSIPQAPSTTAHNLVTLQTNRTQRRFAFLVGVIVCLISLLSIPYARVKLTELQAYQPAIFSTVICFEIITVFVLYSQFRVSR